MKKNKEYSKVLLIQESALIWVLTIGMMGLAYLCIIKGFTGSLPWLAAMVACPWTAYGVSQAFYYRKSSLENTKNGIKYDSVMTEINAMYGNTPNLDWTVSEDMRGEDCECDNTFDIDYGI